MQEPWSDLFRAQVLDARKVRLEGEVFLSQPLNARVATWAITVFVVALAVWVGTGRYARVEPSKGVLSTDAESAKIVALRPGIVTRLLVTEGQLVKLGQTLATVQIDQQYADGLRATQESLAAVEAQREQATRQIGSTQEVARSERAGLIATIASAREQYASVKAQIAIQEQLVTSLRQVLDRYRPIAEKGYISKTEMDRREQELLTAQQATSRLQQQLTSLSGDEAKAAAELSRSRAQEGSQDATVRSSVAGFRLQSSQLRAEQSYVLTAPIAGRVTAVQTGIGRTVDASVPLMTVVPMNAHLHADLYAPSRSIGFVKEGEEVRLLYDAFPYERFGSYPGRIQTVSRVALDPRQVDALLKLDEPVYRLRVTLQQQSVNAFDQKIRLQPGMTLSASIVLERRSFADWLLEPLNAVMKRDR